MLNSNLRLANKNRVALNPSNEFTRRSDNVSGCFFLNNLSYSTFFPQASINPLQGILNCLVYGQHRQFASCCSHILSQGHSGSTSLPNNNRNRRFTVNSHSESVRIPVSEISPLLSDRRITPVAPTPPLNSPRNEPFAVRLLGEFAK